MEYSPSEPDSGDSPYRVMVPKFMDHVREGACFEEEPSPPVWLAPAYFEEEPSPPVWLAPGANPYDLMPIRYRLAPGATVWLAPGANPYDLMPITPPQPPTPPPPTDGGITLPLDLLHVPSNLLETILQDESSRPHDIPLRDLQEITDNFSDERILGQGGFGVVYKGVLPNGKMIVVKKIVSSLMPGLQKQFESEMNLLDLIEAHATT